LNAVDSNLISGRMLGLIALGIKTPTSVLTPPSRNPTGEKALPVPLISGGHDGESTQVFHGASVAADGKTSADEVGLGSVAVEGTDTDRPNLLVLVVPVVS
jgi:hypothetical protein